MDRSRRTPLLDELEIRCIRALQEGPRSSWRKIAAEVGVDQRTVAKRMQALFDGGHLRIVTEVDPVRSGTGTLVSVRVRCDPAHTRAFAESVAEIPGARFVALLASAGEVLIELVIRDRPRLVNLFAEEWLHTEGVLSVSSQIVLRTFRRAAEWRMSLPGEGEPSVRQPTDDDTVAIPHGKILTEVEEKVIAELLRDGRSSVVELARAAEVSESTVRRVVQELERRGIVTFRVEIEPALLGYGTEAVINLAVQPGAMNDVQARLSRNSRTRCLFGTSGASQLFWHVVCVDERELWELLTESLQEGVISVDSLIVLEALKRGGLAVTRMD